TINAPLQDCGYAAVGMGTDYEHALRRCLQPCGAVLLFQLLQAQTGAVASFWVGLLAQDRGYQGGRLRTDLARPGDQRRGSPLSMCAVRRRHVLWVGRVLPLLVAA